MFVTVKQLWWLNEAAPGLIEEPSNAEASFLNVFLKLHVEPTQVNIILGSKIIEEAVLM